MLRSALASLLMVAFSFLLPAQGWVDRTTWNGPSPRYGHAMCFDPVRGYVILAGGYTGGQSIGDTWTWDGTTWTQRGSTPSSPYNYTAMAYHAPTSEVILGVPNLAFQRIDTFAWNGAAWESRGLVSQTFGSGHVAMAFDPARGQTVLYAFGTSIHLWDGNSWVTRPLPTVPTLNCGHATWRGIQSRQESS